MAFSVYWYLKRDAFESANEMLKDTTLYRRCAELEQYRTEPPNSEVFGWFKPRGNAVAVNEFIQEVQEFRDAVVRISCDDCLSEPLHGRFYDLAEKFGVDDLIMDD